MVAALLSAVTVTHAQSSGSWQAQDVGSVATAGSSQVSGGTFTVEGSGADIWGANDAFHFYAQTLTGDGAITARITGITNTNPWAKAGVMIRDSLVANAQHVFLAATPDWHGISALQRASTGGETTRSQGPTVYAPYWLRLTRVGATVTAETSPNGSTWTSTDSFNIAMGATVYIGLAVSSHDDGVLCTATFDNVTLVGGAGSGPPPAAPTDLRVTGAASNQVTLAWTDNATNESNYQLWRSLDAATFTLLATLPAGAIGYTDDGLASSTTYFYRVRAVNAAGESTYSAVATATTSAPGGTGPAAPTGLTATALSPSQIELKWTDHANDETTFEIQRSSNGAVFGITYSGSAPNTTAMTDTALTPSTRYYYRVRAVNASGASAYSNIADATTPATSSPPPSGTWQSGDVGSVAMAGSDSTSGTTVALTGGGADIWDRADSFRYRYQVLNGDGSITARVVSMTNTDNWAKAGVMIRNSLVAGSRNVFAAVTPAWNGSTAQARTTDGGLTTSTRGATVNAPYWLRLTRAGTTFTAEASSDGVAWSTYATFNVVMDESVAVGLAVTSHNQNALCTATFDNVTIGGDTTSPPPGGAWSAADIGAVGVAGSHTASNSMITISGSGADIWGSADAFRFVWQTRTGDDLVEAQIVSMGNTNGWAKAGVMIRESADAHSPNVFVALTPTWHGIVAQARGAAGGHTTVIAGPANNAPYWLRLKRTGDTFTASTSPDGVNWTPFASFSVRMSSTAQFGFAVTSHDNAQLNQAVFQDPYVGSP